MTRKDFEAVAKIIALYCYSEDTGAYKGGELVDKVNAILKKNNKNFNEAMFWNAVTRHYDYLAPEVDEE